MLVLTRKQQEKVRIGDDIVITVLRMKGKAVRLGIEAPGSVPVLRGELVFETPVDDQQGDSGNESADQGGATSMLLERVPRDAKTQILPQLVEAGGPLRAMLESRAATA